jgi:hypothetical protein
MAEPWRRSQRPERPSVCPLCGGTIPQGVKKCLFCATVVTRTEVSAGDEGGTHIDVIGSALLVVPGMIVAFTLGYVIRLNALQNPVGKLLVGGFVAALASAVLVMLEARRAGDQRVGQFTPRQWFFLNLLAWPVGYPLYLRERASSGLKDLMIPGVVISVVFTLTFMFQAATFKTMAASARRDSRKASGKSGVKHYDVQLAKDLLTSISRERAEAGARPPTKSDQVP